MNEYKIILVFVFLFLSFIGVQGQKREKEPGRISSLELYGRMYPEDWHHRAFDRDSLYGAELYKAHEYLQGRTSRKVIVAILDGGGDVTHEDLKESLWTNRGEIHGNGIDDDGNGFVDDIHGWNFLGYPDGEQIQTNSFETDREFLRLEKYMHVDTSKLSRKEKKEYLYFREVWEKSQLYGCYRRIAVAQAASFYLDDYIQEFESRYPGKELVSGNTYEFMEGYLVDSGKGRAFKYISEMLQRKMTKDDLLSGRLGWADSARATYEKYYKSAQERTEGRLKADRNVNSLKKRNHGNGNLLGKNAEHALHVAGIVGATRENGVGCDGVADVELMLLRVSAGWGDEWDKDVASAIYYAVENGAKVINMSFGKYYSPQKELVFKAMKFAEKRGVLLIHGAGNNSLSNDEVNFFPVKYAASGKSLNNMIVVGSSSSAGTPSGFSNYGKSGVDIFAPGDQIHSLAPLNGYKRNSGTSMASPVVAGVAALIWSYFPALSADEVKRAILEGVTSRKGIMVEKPVYPVNKEKMMVYFGELSVSAGILNAYQAIKLAEKMSKNK